MKRWVLLALVGLLALPVLPVRAGDLSVMTFNLRYPNQADGPDYYWTRKPRVIEVLRRYDPDLVGTQEGMQDVHNDLIKELPEYDWFGLERSGKGVGEVSGILYKKARFRLLSTEMFWLSDTPSVPASRSWGNSIPRGVAWGVLEDRETGEKFLFACTHFDHQSQPSREKSAALAWERIAAASEGLPVVFVGDFNANTTNRAIRFLRGEEEIDGKAGGLRDAYTTLHDDAEEQNTFNGFGASVDRKNAMIDWIFYTPEYGGQAHPTRSMEVESVEIIDEKIDGRYPSDHYPVMARLRL